MGSSSHADLRFTQGETNKLRMADLSPNEVRQITSDGIRTSMEQFLEQNRFTDVIVVCRSTEVFAHKVMLCGASPYFLALLRNSVAPITRLEIDENIDPRALRMCIRFIYTGNILEAECKIENLASVLIASNILHLRLLNDYSWQIVMKKMTVDDFPLIWPLRYTMRNQDLSLKLNAFVVTNLTKILEKKIFLVFNFDDFSQLLQVPQVRLHTSDVIVKSIVKWVKFGLESRQNHLVELMSNFSLHNLSSSFLGELVRDEATLMMTAGIHNTLLEIVANRLGTVPSAPPLAPSEAIVRNMPSLPVASLPFRFQRDDVLRRGKLISCYFNEGLSMYKYFDFNTQQWSETKQLSFQLESGTSGICYEGFGYFVGGGSEALYARNTMFVYDFDNESLVGESEMVRKRFRPGTVVFGGQVYVVGGLGGSAVMRDVERYHVETSAWTTVASTNGAHLAPNVVVMGNRIYIVGSSNCSLIEYYESFTNTWTRVNRIPISLATLSLPVATVCQDKLFVLRNLDDTLFHIYLPNSDSWNQVPFGHGLNSLKIEGMWSDNAEENRTAPAIYLFSKDQVYRYNPNSGETMFVARVTVPMKRAVTFVYHNSNQ